MEGDENYRPLGGSPQLGRALAACARRSVSAGPVFDEKILESPKILHIRGHDDQVIYVRDRRDLAIRG